MFDILTRRRHKEILKNVVLKRALLFRFLHEQKMKALGRVTSRKLGLLLPADRQNKGQPYVVAL